MDWFVSRNIRDDDTPVKLVKISHTRIKVGLQYISQNPHLLLTKGVFIKTHNHAVFC